MTGEEEYTLDEERLTLEEMQAMQRALQEKYMEKWHGLGPWKARDTLLWMVSEAGEAAQILKHEGNDAAAVPGEARARFVEEMCDVLMYWNDAMLCFGVTPEEIARAYRAKHQRNMSRW